MDYYLNIATWVILLGGVAVLGIMLLVERYKNKYWWRRNGN